MSCRVPVTECVDLVGRTATGLAGGASPHVFRIVREHMRVAAVSDRLPVPDAVHGIGTDSLWEAAISQSPAPATPGNGASANEDREIVSRISSGDVAAFEDVYRRYASNLLRFAYSKLNSREAAEDVVQELFLAVWRHRKNWRLNRSIKSYLFGALRNQIVSYRRSTNAREGRLQRVEKPDNSLASLPGSSGADHGVREAELADAIKRAIEELTPRCRETFLLVRQHHLSYAEAADALGISKKGVEMNMVRALAALREQLASWRD